MNVADAVIEELALSEARMIERVIDLTTERDAYRTLAQQLLHALHRAIRERDRSLEQRAMDRRRERDERSAAA